jgi:hypothetical protein
LCSGEVILSNLLFPGWGLNVRLTISSQKTVYVKNLIMGAGWFRERGVLRQKIEKNGHV